MKPAPKREMVDHVRGAWRVSIRRACRAVSVDHSTYHYRSKRARQAPLAKRIREIAETRVRHGYRRIHVLLRREGWPVIPSMPGNDGMIRYIERHHPAGWSFR